MSIPEQQQELLDVSAALRLEGSVPLSTASGYATVLLRGDYGTLSPEQSQILTLVVSEITRATRIWRHQAEYLQSTYREAELRPNPGSELLTSIRDYLVALHPNPIVENDIHPEHTIHYDPGLLYIVFKHLVDPLTFSDPPIHTTIPRVSIQDMRNGTVSISICPQSRSKYLLTEAATLVKQPGSSLHIAERIIRKHNSALTFTHTPESITFHFSLVVTP